MILLKILTMSLFCFGSFKSIESFLWKIWGMDTNDLAEKLPKWATFTLSPVLFCIYCSASFWGTIGYALIGLSGYGFNVSEWVLCVIATAGMNAVLDYWTEPQL
jgi:hypothetical protein